MARIKRKRLSRQINSKFENEPRKSANSTDEHRATVNDCFRKNSFNPMVLVETIKKEYNPIVYVGGCFYFYDHCGVWKGIDNNLLGQFAAKQLGSNARARYIDEAVKLLAYNATKTVDVFQPKRGYLNLKNGMLHVKTGQLKKHAPRYNSRIQLPYSFDPEANCPRWRKFLREIFADDLKKRKTLKQWFGYCLTDETSLQQFMVLKGQGGNGKTVTLSILSDLVGHENVCAISLRKMEKDFMLIVLKDKLVNLCGELKTSKQFDSDTIKSLTGEDLITVDVKYKSPVTFRPTAKHVFSTNELPKFRDKTEALRRRIALLTFEQTFKGKKCNKNLIRELLTELPGIMQWALEGWKQLQKTKELYESPSTLKHRDEFAETLNPVLAFIRRACKLGDNWQKIKRTTLYRQYRHWHISNIGDHPLSKPAFFERVRDDFPEIAEVRIHGEDYFKDIKVLKPPLIKKKARGKKGKPFL